MTKVELIWHLDVEHGKAGVGVGWTMADLEEYHAEVHQQEEVDRA